MSWERFSTSICTDQQVDYPYLKEQISLAARSPLQVTEVEVDENTFKSFCHQLDLRLRHDVSEFISHSESFLHCQPIEKKRIMAQITARRKRCLQLGKTMSSEVTTENNQEVILLLSSQFREDCLQVIQQILT